MFVKLFDLVMFVFGSSGDHVLGQESELGKVDMSGWTAVKDRIWRRPKKTIVRRHRPSLSGARREQCPDICGCGRDHGTIQETHVGSHRGEHDQSARHTHVLEELCWRYQMDPTRLWTAKSDRKIVQIPVSRAQEKERCANLGVS